MGRKIIFSLLTLLISGVVTLALAELILRMAGYEPQRNVIPWPQVPITQQPDSVLGWRNKPGRHVYPPFAPGLADIRLTIGRDGNRTTGTPETANGARLAVFGCSYVEGQHISDEETFAWKLQSRYTGAKVANYGVSGYGTYQSRLLMEEVLARPDPPQKVLYGFMEHHEARNVANSLWLKNVSRHSTRGQVALPFATVDAERHLVKHPKLMYPHWPLADRLALVSFMQDLYVRLEARRRESQEIPVTQELIREMNELAKQHGVQFAVVLLYGLKPEGKLDYINYFKQHNIEHYDCQHTKTPDLVVPGEGHPNGKLNTLWAKCIAKSLESAPDNKWIPRKEWAELEAGAAIISQHGATLAKESD